MKRKIAIGYLVAAAIGIGACSSGSDSTEPAAAADAPSKTNQVQQLDVKAGSPFAIRYEVIGTPIVGSPVALDIQVTSALGPTPLEIGIQIPDPSAMVLHTSQPEKLQTEITEAERTATERVTVVPMREGRLFINISASADVEGGTISTMQSIPLHVGVVDTGPQEHGEVEITEEGEAIKVLKD